MADLLLIFVGPLSGDFDGDPAVIVDVADGRFRLELEELGFRALYPQFDLVPCSTKYPAGAEKLILKKLLGKMPAPGTRPRAFGYVV